MVYINQHFDNAHIHAASWMTSYLQSMMTDSWLEQSQIPIGQIFISKSKYKTYDNIIGKKASPFGGDHYLVGVDETDDGIVIRQYKTMGLCSDPNTEQSNCFTFTLKGFTIILETRDTFDQNTFNKAACVSQCFSNVVTRSWNNYQSVLICTLNS